MERRVILHIDMDAFFTSVEQNDNPDLQGKPVLIGDGERGVISAASYEARKFGVFSAMSVAIAKKKCPEGIFLKGRMSRYKEVSKNVMNILSQFSPLVEQASIDEAYLDISGTGQLFGSSEELALALKSTIKKSTGLNCSVGIAPNKVLAKIVSDWKKPDGLFILKEEDVSEFMRELPVKKIPGVGKVFQKDLAKYNIIYGRDVLKYSINRMEELFQKRGAILYRRIQGFDDSPVKPHRLMKSTSSENTFAKDIDDKKELKKWLMKQSETVGAELRRHGFHAKTITLKLKYIDFTVISRSHSFETPTNSTKLIYQTAVKLLMGVKLKKAVRLIGVGASNFDTPKEQLSLFENKETKENKLDKALDKLRKKHGKSIINRGLTLEE